MKCLLAILLSLSGFAAISQSAREWFDKAMTEITTTKNYQLAVEHCNKALALDPQFAEAYNRRGYTRIFLKQFDEAVKDCNEAIRLEPKMAKAYFNRGSAYYWQNKFSEAVADFNRCAEIDTNTMIRDWYERHAYALTRLNRYAESLPLWDKAIQISPGYAVNWLNRGIARHQVKNLNGALTDLTEAIRLYPNQVYYHSYRGTVYFELNKYKEAASDYEKAASLDPKNAGHWLNLADAWFKNVSYAQAIAALNKYLLLNTKNDYAWSLRGVCRNSSGNFKEAIPDFTEAIKLNPAEPRNYNNRGYAYYNLKQYQQAVADYDKGVSLLPAGSTPFYTFKADALDKMGKSGGNNAESLYTIAMGLLDLKKYREAKEHFTRCIALKPNDARAYYGRYLCNQRSSQDFVNRIKDLEKAVQLDPNKADYHYWLGFEFYLGKRHDDAIREYDRTMALGGSYMPAQNPNVIGNGNYKEVILNQRNPPATASQTTPSTPAASPNKQDLNKIITDLAEGVRKNFPANTTIIESGNMGNAGKIFTAEAAFPNALTVVLIYPSATRVEVHPNIGKPIDCSTNSLGYGISQTICTQQNTDAYYQYTQSFKFWVRVNGDGPVHYIFSRVMAKK